MITMRIDDRAFKRDMKRFREHCLQSFRMAIVAATTDLVKTAKILVRDYTRNSKVRSSFLINNIRQKIATGGLRGEVISAAGYSQAFEEGTRPHIIRVRNKQVLAGPKRGAPPGWVIGAKSAAMGYATYGKEVKHPGTEPHPFMYPAWRKACLLFEQKMRNALR